MTPQEFYVQQSTITDPGTHTALFDAIPDDIESICQASRNVLNHYIGDPRYKPAKERWGDLDTRYVSKIVDRVLELDDSPLTEARSDENRFVGCCRDFTALTVSIMRHKSIPARSRYGTAVYFEEGYYWDHVIVEYWNGGRWIPVDAQLSHEDRDWGFDIRDVPRDQFLVAGKGWQLVRDEKFDAAKFGLGSIRGGLEFIVTEMMLDIAALNQEEHLCWECWGYSDQFYNTYTEEDYAFLDEVAAITQDYAAFEQWRELFKHPKLALPAQVNSFSPAADPAQYPIKVQLVK